MNDSKRSVVERLKAHPNILECVEAMLDIVEAPLGNVD
jgi:hypothetical protein